MRLTAVQLFYTFSDGAHAMAEKTYHDKRKDAYGRVSTRLLFQYPSLRVEGNTAGATIAPYKRGCGVVRGSRVLCILSSSRVPMMWPRLASCRRIKKELRKKARREKKREAERKSRCNR